MTSGRLIAIVGPSGAGKDSVMAGLHAALPGLHLVRRVITRPPEPGVEDHDAVSVPVFEAMAEAGEFALHWQAHGLCYGVRVSALRRVEDGTDCLVNLSRSVLGDAARLFPRLVVLNVTARSETLARRLAGRGRESEGEIASRLARAERALPQGLCVINLPNDGPLADTVARAANLLQPASA